MPAFLADTNVFISAHRSYYAFDICPGFWDAIVHHYHKGQLYSIDKVRDELLEGDKDDKICLWINDHLPPDFFHDTKTDSHVMDIYQSVIDWARQQSYTDAARGKFASKADSWIVAYAKAYGAVVITHEKSDPGASGNIKIPDVCKEFGVKCENTFCMLRAVGAQFHLKRA